MSMSAREMVEHYQLAADLITEARAILSKDELLETAKSYDMGRCVPFEETGVAVGYGDAAMVAATRAAAYARFAADHVAKGVEDASH